MRPQRQIKDRRRLTSTFAFGAALSISPLHRLQNYRSTLTTYPFTLPARFRLANNSPHGDLVRRILSSLSLGRRRQGRRAACFVVCLWRVVGCGRLQVVARAFSQCFVCVDARTYGSPQVDQNELGPALGMHARFGDEEDRLHERYYPTAVNILQKTERSCFI